MTRFFYLVHKMGGDFRNMAIKSAITWLKLSKLRGRCKITFLIGTASLKIIGAISGCESSNLDS